MGFLGYLHVGITVDRLKQEYGSEVTLTALSQSNLDYRHGTDCPL